MTANWIGWMMSGIVLILLFAVGAIVKNPVRLLITGERARGIVVGMDVSSPASVSDSSIAGASRSPLVEFVTSAGERVRVSGRFHSATPSARVGDTVTVAYDPSQPRDAQLLIWKEFAMAGLVLGFTGFVLLLWMSGILVSQDPAYGDPFHLLPALIFHFRLNPVRLPVLFVLAVAILTSGPATYVLFKRAHDLRSNGITAVGHVIGSRRASSRLNDGSATSGVFPMIAYADRAGTEHTIRGSLARPWSRLRTGDPVEVIYLARRPDRGVLNTWYEFYPPPLFFGFMAIAFLAMFGLVLRGTIRL